MKREKTIKQKEDKRLYDKKRYYENKEREILRKKEYFLANKERVNEYHKAYNKIQRKTNPNFKLTCLIRTAIGDCFRTNGYTKASRTYDILGCSFDTFKQHLEAQFESWMSWDNHGLYNGTENHGWDIDHIIPVSSAVTEEDVIRLNHYSNLQPLCSYTNRYVKRNKFMK